MRRVVAAVLLLSLLGCVRHVVRVTNEWRGRHIREAITEMGPPREVTPNGSTTLYLWSISASTKHNAFRSTLRTCEGWFEVDTATQIIQRYDERGDDC